MKSIILAAGKGTRLGYLTKRKPKCLNLLNGKTILGYQINVMKSCKINNICIVGGYLHNLIKNKNLKKYINVNYATTNMVSTLFTASKEFENDSDILISYGDIIYSREVLKKLLLSKSPISLTIDINWKEYWYNRMDNPLEDAESLKLDKDDNILDIGNKVEKIEHIEGQYMGLIKIRKEIVRDFLNHWKNMDKTINYNGKDFNNIYMTSFLQNLIDNQWKIKAVKVHGGWCEIDTPQDILIAEKWLRNKPCDLLCENFYDENLL